MRGAAVLLGALLAVSPVACGARTGLEDSGAAASTSATTTTGVGGAGGQGDMCIAGPCMNPSHPGDPVWNGVRGSMGQQAATSVAFDAAGDTLLAGNLYGPDS